MSKIKPVIFNKRHKTVREGGAIVRVSTLERGRTQFGSLQVQETLIQEFDAPRTILTCIGFVRLQRGGAHQEGTLPLAAMPFCELSKSCAMSLIKVIINPHNQGLPTHHRLLAFCAPDKIDERY
jgi:hypothetical protein